MITTAMEAPMVMNTMAATSSEAHQDLSTARTVMDTMVGTSMGIPITDIITMVITETMVTIMRIMATTVTMDMVKGTRSMRMTLAHLARGQLQNTPNTHTFP